MIFLLVIQWWGISLPWLFSWWESAVTQETAQALLELDSDEWRQTVDFLVNQAWVTTWINVTFDTTAWYVKGDVAWSSYIYLSEVEPSAFKWREEVQIDYTGNPTSISTQILSCADAGSTVLKTIAALPVNGIIDISDIDHVANPCIQSSITFGDTSVLVNEVTVTWEPLPFLATTIIVPETKQSCGTTIYNVAYSLSYASDTDIVLYSPLPSSTWGTVTGYTAAYNQFPTFNPSFVLADKWGQYTATAITVRGIAIPANSVYRERDEINEWETDILTYIIDIPCGTENGVIYQANAYVDGVRADSASTPVPANTEIISTPKPQIYKTDTGTIKYDDEPINNDENKHYVYSGFNTIIDYTVYARNANHNQLGSEVLFNPIVEDDMSDLAVKFASECSGGTLQDRFTLTSSQTMTRSGDIAIFSDLGDYRLGKNPTTAIQGYHDTKITYNIDYSGCALAGTTFYNQASLYGDNSAPVKDEDQVEILVQLSTNGIWAKGHFGDFFYGQWYGKNQFDVIATELEHHSPSDDNPRPGGQPHHAFYGDEFYYTFSINNKGPLRLDNNIITDLLPAGVEFIDAWFGIPPGMNYSHAKASIATVSGGTTDTDGFVFYTDQTNLPAFNTGLAGIYAGNPGSWWSSTDFGTGTKGIMLAPSCLNSSYFPVPTGENCYNDAVKWRWWIKVKVPESTSCDDVTITNTGRWDSYHQWFDTNNFDGQIITGSLWADGISSVTIKPPQGAFQIYADIPDSDAWCVVGDCNPKDIFAPDTATYRYTISNQGSEQLFSGQIVVDIPQLTIAGVLEYLPLTNVMVINATVDYSQVASGQLLINIGQLAPDQWVDLSVTFQIPQGIVEGDIYDVVITTTGSDNYCGSLSNTKVFQTTVHGLPQLEITKYVDKVYIPAGWTITYSLDTRNKGVGDSSHSFVVDRIPDDTAFVSATTSGGVAECASSTVFSCPGCQVYMADIANVWPGKPLPSDPNPIQPFTPDQIFSNFQLGTDNGNGTRSAPAGMDVAYVAFLLDDESIGYLPAQSDNRCIGLSVEDTGNSISELIVNNAAILSEQNLQAISNQVRTTLLGVPWLQIDIYSDPHTYVAACEEFDWIVDWYHDASDFNNQTYIDIVLPSTVIYSGDAGDLMFNWNDRAILSWVNGWDITPFDITSDSNVTVFIENGNTVIRTHINDENTGWLLNDVPSSASDYLQPLRWGSFHVHVQAKCGLPEDATLIAETVGEFENILYDGEVSDTDPVIIKAPDLRLVKNIDMSDPLLGGTINYVFDISNQWEYRANNVTFSDTLPEYVCYEPGSFLWITPSYLWTNIQVSGDCLAGGQTITAELASTPEWYTYLPAESDTVRVTYAATIDLSYPIGVTGYQHSWYSDYDRRWSFHEY